MVQESIDIIIPYGGLGDSLFYSPLPRQLKQSGVSKVNVHCLERFRSKDIKRVVWSMNPYVDDIYEHSKLPDKKISRNIRKNQKINLLSKIARSYDIFSDLDLKPELYYRPKIIGSLVSKTIVDLNYVSFVGAFSKKEILSFVLKKKELIFINKPNWVGDSYGESITPKNLEHYIDIIHTAKEFLCFTSGGATLADAINKKAICLYGFGQNKIFHHSNIHEYVNCSSKNLIITFSIYTYLKLKRLFGV